MTCITQVVHLNSLIFWPRVHYINKAKGKEVDLSRKTSYSKVSVAAVSFRGDSSLSRD